MRKGDFAQAWKISDHLRATNQPDPHRVWQGEPLAGKRVLVRSLHGFGDAIQFLRYLPRLQSDAASVCLQVAPELVPLARSLEGATEVVPWSAPGAPEPSWDVQVELTELPYLFRTQLQDLPIATRYLKLPGMQRSQSPRRQIGLAWKAGSWNPQRSIDFDLLRPLLEVPGCDFWNLQSVEAPGLMHEDDQAKASPLGLAHRIAQLDLVITVDTLAAHLAGALGIPAWVLLQRDSDWRWMESRDDTPWYPTLQLFRQQEQGNWHPPIARILKKLTQPPNPGAPPSRS